MAMNDPCSFSKHPIYGSLVEIKLIPNAPTAQQEKTNWLPIVNGFFLSIATVLGTGILGMPVSLWRTGFYPFFWSSTITLIAQLLLVAFMIELLKFATRNCLLQESQATSNATEGQSLVNASNQDLPFPLKVFAPEVDCLRENIESLNESGDNGSAVKSISLHTLSTVFLNRHSQIIFNVAVMLHFISVLVSYGLAGPEALGALINVSPQYLVFPFVFSLSVLVIVGYNNCTSAITIFTLAKVVILVAVIGAVGYIGNIVNLSFTSSWSYISEPFLLGTVALGGVVNVVPVLFEFTPYKEISKLRISVLFALICCWFLNLIWAYFVLQVVPQTANPTSPHLTLEEADKKGWISTVVILWIVEKKFPALKWFSSSVHAFIVLSIVVSYLTISTAMKHILDGYIHSIIERAGIRGRFLNIRFPTLLAWSVYSISFGLVMIIALLNPSEFLVVLEFFTSFALNLESGVLVAIMFGIFCSISKMNSNLTILLSKTWICVALFYSLAVVVDAIVSFNTFWK